MNPSKSRETGHAERLMARQREIGLEFRGLHREVGQRASTDDFDRVMEHEETKENWIKADHREQLCWRFEEQRDHREGDSICARNDQDDSKRGRRKVEGEDIRDALHVAVDRRTRRILVNEVRSRSQHTRDCKGNQQRCKVCCEQKEEETNRRSARKNGRACGRMACISSSKQPREKSSWVIGMACGSKERSGGRQRERDGNETTWR